MNEWSEKRIIKTRRVTHDAMHKGRYAIREKKHYYKSILE